MSKAVFHSLYMIKYSFANKGEQMELKKLMEHISLPRLQTSSKVVETVRYLLLTICAVISGAEGWEDIEDFGETHLDF